MRYQATPKAAFSFRGEWFSDPRGARTGVGQQLAGLTVTPEYKLADHVVVRAELRRDWSNHDVFERAFVDRAQSAGRRDIGHHGFAVEVVDVGDG